MKKIRCLNRKEKYISKKKWNINYDSYVGAFNRKQRFNLLFYTPYKLKDPSRTLEFLAAIQGMSAFPSLQLIYPDEDLI